MDATEILIGAGVGLIGKICFDWLQRPRSSENGNGNKAGNVDAAIWRLWIREECKMALREEHSGLLHEIHDRADENCRMLHANHEVMERHTAILRDIRDKK